MYKPRPPTSRRIVQETYELRYPKVDVFARPDVNSPTIGELKQGDEFQVIGTGVITGADYTFYQVRLNNGLHGFIFTSNLRGAPPPSATSDQRYASHAPARDVEIERLPFTPSMRASLAFYESWLPLTLTLGFASVGICLLITVRPTEMRWELA